MTYDMTAEVKLVCGCYAVWRPGEGVTGDGYVVTASAFACYSKHAQGDFVPVEVIWEVRP